MGMVISHSVQQMKGEATARCGAGARCGGERAAASRRSSELSSSSSMLSFSCALCTGSSLLGEEQRRRVVETKYREELCLFMSSLLLGTQTDFEGWARKMNTQDTALCHFAVKLLCWMKIFNSFESKCIASLEVKILWKSQRKEGRGIEKLYISKC